MDSNNPLITKIFPDVPQPLKGIMPGMKFKETNFVLRLNYVGNVRVVTVHDTYVVGEYWIQPNKMKPTRRPRRKFWIVGNGLLVRFKLDPSPHGYVSSELGRYEPFTGGPTTISGRYPYYWASTGERVWISADGCFYNREPEYDIVRQLIMKRSKALTVSRRNRETEPEFTQTFRCLWCGTNSVRKRRTKVYCSPYCRLMGHLHV